MEIQQKLIQYRYHFIIAILDSFIISFLSYVAPRLLTYFWPPFASTTVFLVAIIAFGGISHLSTEAHGKKAVKVCWTTTLQPRPGQSIQMIRSTQKSE
ncbi:hypothetical protein REPUB_Repub14bG0162300 [Reevesia pubescens]